ncbi:MAG: hypothetical protein ABJB74_00655 [Gemmatimonas sp.]
MTAPNLSAANGVLGNWLTNPLSLNANWISSPAIPNSWTIGTEVAIMYQFNTLGATNVVARFGVDNGIYAWLDGTYLLGRRDPGGVSLGEYTLGLGNLSAGTHFLQLLVEDHGSANGYAVDIKADEFIPGPAPRQRAAFSPIRYHARWSNSRQGLYDIVGLCLHTDLPTSNHHRTEE